MESLRTELDQSVPVGAGAPELSLGGGNPSDTVSGGSPVLMAVWESRRKGDTNTEE